MCNVDTQYIHSTQITCNTRPTDLVAFQNGRGGLDAHWMAIPNETKFSQIRVSVD